MSWRQVTAPARRHADPPLGVSPISVGGSISDKKVLTPARQARSKEEEAQACGPGLRV